MDDGCDVGVTKAVVRDSSEFKWPEPRPPPIASSKSKFCYIGF